MKEQLYTIPVNDAFDTGCECPMCRMYADLEKDAVEYTMGSSYMQEDIRGQMNKVGFCKRHIAQMYINQNRLGLALMLDTHQQKVIKDMKKLMTKGYEKKSSRLFNKNGEEASSPVVKYARQMDASCFVCDRIELSYPRYVDTIFYLWKNDSQFRNKFKDCKGFCISHYADLYDESANKIPDKDRAEFIDVLNEVYMRGLERVHDDVSWFIEKYDYRNKDAPWKEAKDALPRAIIKSVGVIPEE